MTTTNTIAATTRADHSIADVPGVSGVTHDGTLVWFVDRYAGDLVALDPETGAVERRLAGLAVTSGLTYDGEHLWGLAGESLLEIHPRSGDVLRRVEVPAGGSGIAWAEGSIWIGFFEGKEVKKVDPRTGAVLKTLAADRFVTGVTWHADALWYGAWESADEETQSASEVRRVDAESGAILERIEKDFLTSGLEADAGGTFWCGDSTQGRVVAVAAVATGGGRA